MRAIWAERLRLVRDVSRNADVIAAFTR